jgi:hypothetical protein
MAGIDCELSLTTFNFSGMHGPVLWKQEAFKNAVF